MKTVDLAPINLMIGENIRRERLLTGQSQSAVGNAIGVTFQQIQKYERGMNGILASRLFMLAAHIGVPPANFFKEPHERPIYEQFVPDNDTVLILSMLRHMSAAEKKALANLLVVNSRAGVI